jgi:hypothetical protein
MIRPVISRAKTDRLEEANIGAHALICHVYELGFVIGSGGASR